MCYQNCAKTIYQSLTRAFLCKLQNLACYKSFLFGTPIHRLLIDRFPFWKTRNNSSNHLVPNLPTIHVVTTHLGLQPASHVHKMSASSRQRSGARNEALSTSSRKLTLQRVPKKYPVYLNWCFRCIIQDNTLFHKRRLFYSNRQDICKSRTCTLDSSDKKFPSSNPLRRWGHSLSLRNRVCRPCLTYKYN